MEPSKVRVCLTPVPTGFRRQITLDKKQTSVTLGRASKNEERGMVPRFDNGWIDSPIVSREHARFEVESWKDLV